MSFLSLLRAGFKCQKRGCNSTANLDVHHKDKNRKNNKPKNLTVLCRYHHLKEHGKDNGTRLPFVYYLILAKDISQSCVAGYLRVTQPAVSQMLKNGNKSLIKYIQVKDFINAVF